MTVKAAGGDLPMKYDFQPSAANNHGTQSLLKYHQNYLPLHER